MAFEQSGLVSELSVDGVAEFLVSKGVRHVLAAEFRRNLVSGAVFLKLTEEDLKELAPLIGERVQLREILKQCRAEVSRHNRHQVDSKQAKIADSPVYSQISIPIPAAQNQACIPASAVQNLNSIRNHTSIPGIQNQTSPAIQNQTSIPGPEIRNQISIPGTAIQSQTTSIPVAQIQSSYSQTSILVPNSGAAVHSDDPDTSISNSAPNSNDSGSSTDVGGPHLVLSNSVPTSNAVPCNLITFQIAPGGNMPVISPDQSDLSATHPLVPTPISSDSGLSVPIYTSNLHSMSAASTSFNAVSLAHAQVNETHGTASAVEPGRLVDPNWCWNFTIPEKHTFLEAVQDSIATGLVTPRAKRGVIQVLRTLILQHTKYPTRDEYNTVCRRLVEKYPKLHDGGKSGCESWKLCLRNSFKNFRRMHVPRESRRSYNRVVDTALTELATGAGAGAGGEDFEMCISGNGSPPPLMGIMEEDDYEGVVMELREENGRGQLRNDDYIKNLMDQCYQMRRKWILEQSPTVAQVLEKFPVLGHSDMLRHEFRCLVETDQSFSNMVGRWEELKPLVVTIGKVESTCRPGLKPVIEEYESLSSSQTCNLTDLSDYVVLNILFKLLNQREVKGRMFIRQLETCDVVDINSNTEDDTHQVVPSIVFTASPGSSEALYFIHHNKLPVCESSSLRDAFLDLVAAYHSFHISYPKVLQAVLLFFQHEVFEVRDDQPRPLSLFTLVSNIQKLRV